jgi:hypothetical protein
VDFSRFPAWQLAKRIKAQIHKNVGVEKASKKKIFFRVREEVCLKNPFKKF